MLWLKGWLETQFKLLLTLGLLGLLLVFLYATRSSSPPPGAKPTGGFTMIMTSFVLVSYSWLAGAGIVTQPSFQATKGLHGSILFTLSLPVSRFRLLWIRASLGWLEMVTSIAIFCSVMWSVVPVFRQSISAVEMFHYAVTVIVCSSALYSSSVLLATFLDDQWRTWGGMLLFGALWVISAYVRIPPSMDIIRAMREGSPLVVHTMPWTTMAFSLALSVTLFIAALKVVQEREY